MVCLTKPQKAGTIAVKDQLAPKGKLHLVLLTRAPLDHFVRSCAQVDSHTMVVLPFLSTYAGSPAGGEVACDSPHSVLQTMPLTFTQPTLLLHCFYLHISCTYSAYTSEHPPAGGILEQEPKLCPPHTLPPPAPAPVVAACEA
jgi:hypothetical protein